LKQNKKLKINNAPANKSLVPFQEAPKHINFFEDIERSLSKTNPEVEAEKRAEERNNMNLLVLNDAKPWYYDLNNTAPVDDIKDKEKERKKNRRLQNEDPLLEMNKYLYEKKKSEPTEKPKKKSIPTKKVDKLTQLRQERLVREKSEREKVTRLLGISQPSIKENTGYSSGSGYSQYSKGIIRDRNSLNEKIKHPRKEVK